MMMANSGRRGGYYSLVLLVILMVQLMTQTLGVYGVVKILCANCEQYRCAEPTSAWFKRCQVCQERFVSHQVFCCDVCSKPYGITQSCRRNHGSVKVKVKQPITKNTPSSLPSQPYNSLLIQRFRKLNLVPSAHDGPILRKNPRKFPLPPPSNVKVEKSE